jgi:hypothetical protein
MMKAEVAEDGKEKPNATAAKVAFRVVLDKAIEASYPPQTDYSYASDKEFHNVRRRIMLGEYNPRAWWGINLGKHIQYFCHIS